MDDRREADVAVVGLWHLGSVAAAGWMTAGRRVVAWDGDEHLRRALAKGSAPVDEPGLSRALHDGIDRDLLRVVDTAQHAIAAAPITHVTYDTRVDDEGRHLDERLDEAVAVFVEAAPDHALLLVSSQLAAGTCTPWRSQLAARHRGLQIAHAPENLRLGRAMEDFLHPPRLLLGSDDDDAFAHAAAALEPFSREPIRAGLTAAEMAKHATNAYLALCVAFANELAWLSLAAGADPAEVATALRADPRVSPTAPLRPGAAFSGATLLRDVVTLRDLGARCGRPELFEAIIGANHRHAHVAIAWLEEALGTVDDRRIAVAGLTYKPGTSTLRDSLPLRLVDELAHRGATVAAWDPLAEPFATRAGVERRETLAEAADQADALLVLTAHPELASVDWRSLQPARRLVVDGCMALERSRVEAAGWVYKGFAVG